MIDFIDKKLMSDSVITGKVNAFKEWNFIVSMFLTVLTCVLRLVMHILCVNVLKLVSDFFRLFGTRS